MRKLVKIFMTMLVLAISYQVQAQEIIITGKVIDQSSREVVPFANIGIKGHAIGTVSNENGEFEFHFPEKHLNDSLFVSCIGYGNYGTAVSEIKDRQAFNIYLTSKEYVLEAVVVRPDDWTAEEIIEKAIKKIPENYITGASLMDGFYREYFKENDKYVAFAEAAVSIYDEAGYEYEKRKAQEAIKINQLRVSDICNEGDYVLYIDINYALRSNLIRNQYFWKKFAKRGKLELQTLAMDSISYYDDHMVYCLSYKTLSKRKGEYSGRIFVRTSDFGVVRVEINASNLLKGREINGAPQESKAVLTYKEYKGKMYLGYINASHDVEYHLAGKKYTLSFNSELLINDVKTERFKPLMANDRIQEVSIFYQPRYRTYQPAFWKDYNLFASSEANAQIIADLEARRPLEKQFRANGKLKAEFQRFPLTAPKPVDASNNDSVPSSRLVPRFGK